MELYVTVVVPKNILTLSCAKRLPKVYKGRHYDLRDYDPDYLVKMIDLVRQAKPNQLIINRKKPKNRKTERALAQYSQANPSTSYQSLEDLVTCIGLDTYAYSTLSTEPGYAGEELHVFQDVEIPGFSTNARTKVYVKFIDPDGQYPIDVISVHRNCDQ